MDRTTPVNYPVAAPGRVVGRQPLRVRLVTDDLYDVSKFCAAPGEGKPSMLGTTTVCDASDVLTDGKRDVLVALVLPEALRRLTSVLSVTPAISPIRVKPGDCDFHTIPDAHGVDGVANADFVLYVSAAPTRDGTVAWAGTCTRDQHGRPVSGRANFGPQYIRLISEDPDVGEAQVDVAMHELLHALGFSSDLFPNNSVVQRTGVRGKETPVSGLTSPEVLAKAREHLGCPTLPFVELEDGGGEGSAGSHWEKRLFRDELMAASGVQFLSVLTLALMKDLGHYDVDYSRAEPMTFSANAGCAFQSEKCNTAGGGSGKQFCFSTNANAASHFACGENNNGIATCDTTVHQSPLPDAYQYFPNAPHVGGAEPFADYCPSMVVGLRCYVSLPETPSAITLVGHYLGPGGKCLNTDGLLRAGADPALAVRYQQRCLKVRCTSNGTLQVSVGGAGNSALASPFVECPSNGGPGFVAAPTGWVGRIECPAATRLCAATPAPPTFPPTPVPPTPQPPPLFAAVMTISGNATVMLLDSTKKAALAAALKTDLERALSRLVTIDSLVSGSIVVRFTVNALSTDSSVDQALLAAQSSPAFLSSTQLTFTAGGGAGSLSVLSITAVWTPSPTALQQTALWNLLLLQAQRNGAERLCFGCVWLGFVAALLVGFICHF